MHNYRVVYTIAGIAALAGLLFGFDTGIISGALPFIDKQFVILLSSPWLRGLMVSMVLIGALIGSITSGRLVDLCGRRQMLIYTAILFLISSLTSAIAMNLTVLLISRLAVGIAIGIASFTAPLYLSEISPAHLRGGMISLNQFFVTIGILAAYLVNLTFYKNGDWRWMLGVGVVPAFLLFVGMLFVPCSPRWKMAKGSKQESRDILRKLYKADDVENVLIELEKSVHVELGHWRELLQPWMRPAIIVGVVIGMLQQFVGINSIIYYAPIVFKLAGFNGQTSPMIATVAVGVINIFMTGVAIWAVDRFGRRPLLLIGLAGMGLSMLSLMLVFFHGGILPLAINKILAVTSVLTYIASFAVSLGILTWIYIAEVFPLRNRGLAVSIAVALSWASNALVSTLFPVFLTYLGGSETFGVFALICLLGLGFAWFKIPETAGCSLEKIEENLRKGVGCRNLGVEA